MTIIDPSPAPKLAAGRGGAFLRFAGRAAQVVARILGVGWCSFNIAVVVVLTFAPVTPGLVDPFSAIGLSWLLFKFLYWLLQIPLVVQQIYHRKFMSCVFIRIAILGTSFLFPVLTSMHAQNSLVYIGYNLFDPEEIKERKSQMVAEHETYIILYGVDWSICHSRIILDPNHNFKIPDGIIPMEMPGETFDEHVYHITADVISEFACIP
jgi:hypothetical protein